MIADELRALIKQLDAADTWEESEAVLPELRTLADRVAELEQDCKQGWDNFYACRKQLAELQYPGMTGTVKVVEARPCPHVVTTGTTSHCSLAERDARDAARLQYLIDNAYSGPSEELRAPNAIGLVIAGNIEWPDGTRPAIDAAMKEQADADRG